ncbi:hypothetical protein BOTNAR_0008g00190 [Botryotinia narcissicola]|uniref:Zinc finger protein n=1 Tax=Botryotinia narcissicola TaxID=278944 RepID=A0A4Z1J8X6_9HELO|nr:hypothetical protein BOTNAR_0008g00190 [Botryotinia narcissicola]
MRKFLFGRHAVENGLTVPNVTRKLNHILSRKPQKCLKTFACKKCKKAFRKDFADETDDGDEYCPHCDNHYVIDAIEPKPILKFEGEDVRKDSRMIKDDRLQGKEQRTIFDVEEAPNKLG